MISFHVNLKVWITEIKAWMYWSGASAYADAYPLGLITERGHRLALFLPLLVEGGNTH
jgi:hypothetical protein